jgi:hypothetical protein
MVIDPAIADRGNIDKNKGLIHNTSVPAVVKEIPAHAAGIREEIKCVNLY